MSLAGRQNQVVKYNAMRTTAAILGIPRGVSGCDGNTCAICLQKTGTLGAVRRRRHVRSE
ncbi:MAG: hypothetical protein WA647_19025 [Candidatus Acidiferrum sp.]